MLFYLVVDRTETSTHVSECFNIFYVNTQEIFYVKTLFFLKFKVIMQYFGKNLKIVYKQERKFMNQN